MSLSPLLFSALGLLSVSVAWDNGAALTRKCGLAAFDVSPSLVISLACTFPTPFPPLMAFSPLYGEQLLWGLPTGTVRGTAAATITVFPSPSLLLPLR